MRNRHRKTSFLLLSLAWLTTLAQHPFYQFDQFDKAAGLTEFVNGMEEDEDGFFWLATGKGLFRFDGVQAVKINYLPSDTLPAAALNIFSLSYDRQNQLVWLATEYGVFTYHPPSGSARHLRAKDFFEEKDICKLGAHVIFTDRQGETWASFGVHGLVNMMDKGAKAEVFSLPLSDREKAEGMDWRVSNSILVIRQDVNNDNVLWLGTRRGLMKFDKAAKRFQRFVFYPSDLQRFDMGNAMPCLHAHANGNIYIGTWNGGLLVFNPATQVFSQFFLSPQGWSPVSEKNHVYSILPDAGENLWISSNVGLTLFEVKNNRFSASLSPNHLHFKDRATNYWQYWGGLRLFHKLKNQTPKHPVPAAFNCKPVVSEVPFEETRRLVYMRTHCPGGLWALNVDRQSWQYFPLPGRAEEEVEIKGFAPTPAGFLVSDEKNRLYLRPPGSDRFQLLPVVFPANCGNLMIKSRADGHTFISGHEGFLFWFQPGNWQPRVFDRHSVGEPQPDHFTGVTICAFDHQGRLWMKTYGGFSIFFPEENRFVHISKKDKNGTHLPEYMDFKSQDEHRMWGIGGDELGWLDPLRPAKGIQKAFKNGSDFPYTHLSIAFFAQGKLWLKASEGLVELDPDSGKHRLFDYAKSSDMEYIGEGKAITFFDNGYAIFHLDSLRQNEEQPKPYVCWFKVFEKRVPVSGDLLSPEPIRLQPGENFFSVGFSALGFFDPQKIKFAYQLEGVNKDWVFPESGVLAASYTNIEGGDYVFKVKAANSRGEWTGRPFELSIHVGTPWYSTAWFRFLALAVLAGIAFFMVKYRLRRQQLIIENQQLRLEQEVSLRDERDRIAAEMHDDLGAGLSTIRFLSLLAKEKETDPVNAGRIDKIASSAAEVMEKMADIIWTMNSRNDLLENFVHYFRRYAGDYFETHGIRLRFEMPEQMPPILLAGEQRRTLLLALKECVHNVVKHAEATEVHIQFLPGEPLEILVQDNGKGISHDLLKAFEKKDKSLTGNGLYSLQRRMEALGGDVILENLTGTTVRLRTGIQMNIYSRS